MLRVALIGAGNHCRRYHAPALARYAREHADCQLAAICDLDRQKAETFAAEYGFAAVHTDIDAMVDAVKPDAICCIVPVARIVPLAIPILERGIPLVVEKPPGSDVAESRALVDAFGLTGTPCMVSSNRRHAPALQAGLQWAADHGPVRYVRGTMYRNRRTEPTFIHSTAFHCMDAMRHVGGSVAAVEPLAMDVAQTRWYCWRLRYDSGAEGVLEILPTCGYQAERYALFGEDYRVEVKLGFFNPGRVRAWHANKLVLQETWDDADCGGEYVRAGGWNETIEFLTAVRESRMPYPTPADTLQTVEFLHAHSGLSDPTG
jgi:predicted dehydrogenase